MGKPSVWGGLKDFAISAGGQLRALSGFGDLRSQDDEKPELDYVDSGDSRWGVRHSPRAHNFKYLEPGGESRQKPTLAELLFLGPGKNVGSIDNSWDYGDRNSHHLPRNIPQDELERFICPDLERTHRHVTHLKRARELVTDHSCLLLDPEDMMVLRGRHFDNLPGSYLAKIRQAFLKAGGFDNQEGITLVFAGAPIIAMGSAQKRFVILSCIPQRHWTTEHVLSDGWVVGHVGESDMMQDNEYILTLPPFQERRSRKR